MFELPRDDEDKISLTSSRLQSTTSFAIRRKRDHQGDVICPAVKKFGFCIGYHGLNVDYNDPSHLLYDYRNCNQEKFDHSLTQLKEKFEKQYKQWQIDAWKEKCKETCPFNSKKPYIPNNTMTSNQCKMSFNKTGISDIRQVKGFLARNKLANSEMNASSITGFSSFIQTKPALRINNIKPTQSKDDSVFKMPNFIRPRASKEKIKTLREWSLSISPKYELIMAGIDSQSLIQIKISSRVNKYTVLTTDQEEIHFTGPIKTNDKDIPHYILSKFTFGFQDDWEDDINLWKRYIKQGSRGNFDWPSLPSYMHDYYEKEHDTLEAVKGSEDEMDLSLTINNTFQNTDKEQSQSDEEMDILPPRKNKSSSRKLDFNKHIENSLLNLTKMTQSNRNFSKRKSIENNLFISEWLPIFDEKKKTNPILIQGKISNSQGKTIKEEEVGIISIISENEFLANNQQKYQLKGSLQDPDKVLPSKIASLCKTGFLKNYKEIIKIWPQLLLKQKKKNTPKMDESQDLNQTIKKSSKGRTLQTPRRFFFANMDESQDLNQTIKKSSKGRILQTPQRFFFEHKPKSQIEAPSTSRLSKENFEPSVKKLQSTSNKIEQSKQRNSGIFRRKVSDFEITKPKLREIVSLNDVRDTPPGVNILRCLTLNDSEEKDHSFEEEMKDKPLNRKLINAYFQRQKKINNDKNKTQNNSSKKKEFKISAKANKLYKELTSTSDLQKYLNSNDNEEDEEESLETESLNEEIEESD